MRNSSSQSRVSTAASARERSFWAAISFSNSGRLTPRFCSRSISSVRSNGKPYVSYRMNASLPDISVLCSLRACSILPSRRRIPVSRVLRKLSSSSAITFIISSRCEFSSGKNIPISAASVGTNWLMKGSLKLRKVYP